MQDAALALRDENGGNRGEELQGDIPNFQKLKQDMLEQARNGDRAQLGPSLRCNSQELFAASNLFMLFSLIFRYPRPEVRLELENQLPLLQAALREYGESTVDLPAQSDLEAEYVALFVNNNGFVPAVPYASFYLDEEGQLLGPSTGRLRRMLYSLGLSLQEETYELEDHLYVLLELCAELCRRLALRESHDPWPQWLGALFLVSYDYLSPMLDKLSSGLLRYASFDMYPAAVRCLAGFVGELDAIYASALGLAQESPAEADSVL